MTWAFEAYRLLNDDNRQVIENNVWDGEPESSKDEETRFGHAAKKFTDLADECFRPSWDDSVFNWMWNGFSVFARASRAIAAVDR